MDSTLSRVFFCTILLGFFLLGCQESETQRWTKQLKSNDAKERLAAAEGLRKLGGKAEDAVTDLILALRDKDEKVVMAVVQALGSIGKAARPAMPRLVQLRKQGSRELRKVINQTLEQLSRAGMPERKLPPLEQLLATLKSSKETKAIAQALVQLGQHQKKAAAHLPLLIENLIHKEKEIRRAASVGLTLMGPDLALPALQKMLKNKDLRMRNNAISTIGAFGPYALPLLDALIAESQDPLEKIRRSSLWSIGMMGPKAKKALPRLLQALKQDPTPFVRATALLSFGRISGVDKEFLPILKAAMRDPYPEMRQTALEFLVRFGNQAKEEILAAQKDTHTSTRALAIRASGHLGFFGANDLPFLQKTLTDQEWEIRLAGVLALQKLGYHARPAMSALQKLLEDPDIRVRKAVLQTFLSIQQAKPEAPRPASPPQAPPVTPPKMPPASRPASSPSSAPSRP